MTLAELKEEYAALRDLAEQARQCFSGYEQGLIWVDPENSRKACQFAESLKSWIAKYGDK